MLYKLEKPDLSKIDTKKVFELMTGDNKLSNEIKKIIDSTLYPAYLYWDKIKYKSLPKEITHKQFWYLTKSWRSFNSIETVIRSEDNNYFKWCRVPGLEEFLHEIDLYYGGNLFSLPVDINESNKSKLISWGIMEEAIASSQLEGATSTREAAKKFLREGRKPKNKSEQMILNNYLSMEELQNNYKNKKLSLEMLFELHAMITKNTLPEEEQFRFRKDEEKIIVEDSDGTVVHIPPSQDFIKNEVDRLIKFANDELDKGFIHPLIKAIMIHFWVGYLHPFIDGNGRLARLLFYWYLLRKDYWAIAFVPISTIIKKSPGQYRDAYIYTEQDNLDLTYFIDYNIRKIKLAIKGFKEYLKEKSNENLKMNRHSKEKYKLNERQIQLLQYLYKNEDNRTYPKSYTKVYSVSKATAIRDIQHLQKLGFLTSTKDGKNVFYYGTKEIEKLFKKTISS